MKLNCRKSLAYLASLIVILNFAPRIAAQNGPIISEFMAANTHTLADQDGQFSDWIEIFNPSAVPVDLAGYYLTDDPARLNKWAFPSVILQPGDAIIVFASGKNRTQDTNLPPRFHTNFQLDSAGEFLALVNPDGVSVESAFDPVYPPQKDDVAYGQAQAVVTTPLLANSPVTILVPTSADQWSADWNALAFTPGAGWVTSNSPPTIGFDTNRATGAPANVAPSGTVVQSTTLGGYPAILAVNGNLADFTHTLGTDTASFWQVTLTNQPAIYSVVLYNRTSCCGSRLRDITVEILSTNSFGEVTNYRSALLNPENAGYSYPNGPASITVDLVALTGGPVLGQIVRVRRTADPDFSGSGGQGNADEAAVLSLGEVVVNATAASGLRPYFLTDLQELMWNKNASAFIRIPFTNNATPDVLALRVRYDDGFVAYLNGVEVARRNAPASPAWNSSATADRSLANAIIEESINISVSIPALVPGPNILAVQVLNASAGNADLLFQAELIASRVSVTPEAYLVDATPEALNNTECYFGEVGDTHFSVDRGFYDTPFSVSITSDTADAVIYYSVNGDEPGPEKGMQYTGPISITNTTVLRARAFKDSWKATDIDTTTYIFINDVLTQAPSGAAPPNFPASWGRNRVDYGMDPTVIAKFTPAEWREAFTQIPSLSFVTEMGNLFDPATGIYANADGHGELWERPGSIELIEPTNAVQGRFQEPCGFRIRGGYSRNSDFVKHSFRVFFRREYGTGKLRYPMFGDEGAKEFDTFDVRTSQNYAWPRETDYNTGRHDTMVREVFCRETLGAMGQPYRRSRYYHLFLNGQYWGMYETDERPEASYGETYFGGNKDNYDVVKCGNHVAGFVTEATDGNFTAWSNVWFSCLTVMTNGANSNYFRILGCNADGTRNRALPVMLDVDNLIDYMLEIFYSGDGDATLSAFLGNVQPNNWFGMTDRTNPDMGFRFFNSDCEHTLGAPNWQADRTGPFLNVSGSNVRNFAYSNPQYFHEELMNNAEYRLRFADHVQKHFFNGGALTPEAGTNRFMRKAVQITKAIRAYEARWGDANTSRTRYSTTDWASMINTVITTWFPTRTATVLQQLKADALYPSVAAPAFSQLGGEIIEGSPLSMSHTNATGEIYYTVDGSDPRLVGGTTNTNAVVYAAPVVLQDNVRVNARVLSGGVWSALMQADFVSTNTIPLRITELMYHPAALSQAELAAGITDVDLFEYVELRNVGPRPINLSGVSFVTGITFTFPNGTILPAGERILVVKNPNAFALRYGSVANVAGTYAGQLDNTGERLGLTDVRGRVIHNFSYSDEWYPVTDGLGFSLCIVDDSAPVAAWDLKSSWRPSGVAGGSPGTANPPQPSFPNVVINEILTHPVLPEVVTLELLNLDDSPADISGWWLSDEVPMPMKYRLPSPTIIPPGSFMLLYATNSFNDPTVALMPFSFSAAGDEACLFSADESANLTGYSYGYSFAGAESGVAFGRHVISTGEEHYVAQGTNSLGTTNLGPKVGPVVISQIMYHPLGIPNNTVDEYVQLVNIATNDPPLALYDPVYPTNTWHIQGGIDFAFPTNAQMAPGSSLILVNFNPQKNTNQLLAFQSKYPLLAALPAFGPYQGNLDNAGERVRLTKPGLPDPNGTVPYIVVDDVKYGSVAPWPLEADGLGAALQRRELRAYGNDPANWTTFTPLSILVQPRSVTNFLGSNIVFSVVASGNGPLSYQWLLNETNLPGAINATYNIPSLTVAHQGFYRVMISDGVNSVSSVSAYLMALRAPVIIRHPDHATVAEGSNVSMTTVATALPFPLWFLWKRDNAGQTNLVSDTTNCTWTITNVQTNHAGEISCTVTNILPNRFALTSRRILTVVQPPNNVTAPLGSNATLKVSSAAGRTWTSRTRYQWQFAGTNLPGATNAAMTLTNLAPWQLGTYTVNVINASNLVAGFSAQVQAGELDSDGDGLPDWWELAHGLNPNVKDAAADGDGDKMTNLEEFLAGTDPGDPASRLYLIIDSALPAGGAVLNFQAVSNRTYLLQSRDSLSSGSWSNLVTFDPTVTNRSALWTNTAPGIEKRLYRLVIPGSP